MDLLINLDGSAHMQMRKLVNKGFTPRRVAALEEKLRARVALDDMSVGIVLGISMGAAVGLAFGSRR